MGLVYRKQAREKPVKVQKWGKARSITKGCHGGK